MKKKKKTIIEENKTSMSKKIGKYAVIVVLYIALVSTLAFIIGTINLIVNADSSIGFSTWKNAYAPSSIEIATSNGSIICGNNDVFESNSSNDNVSFDDYYSVVEETEEEDVTFNVNVNGAWLSGGTFLFTYTLPSDLILGVSIFSDYFTNNIQWVGNGDYQNYLYLDGSNVNIDIIVRSSYTLTLPLRVSDSNNSSLVTSSTIINSNFYCPYDSGGGADGLPGFEGPSASINYKQKDNNIMTLSNVIPLATISDDISIKRVNNATYNSNGYYDVVSSIDSDIITNFYLSFTRDFVVQYSDFSSGQYRYDYQATDEFVITKGYYLNYYDLSGVLQRVNINSSMSYDSNDIVSLLPTLNEITLEIGEDNINQSDIYLIEDLYVQISCPLTSGSSNNHTFYWVGVNNTRYSIIVNDLPNQFWKTTEFNVGEFLLNSVNSFLGFELIPGFSLLSLLALVIGIPLLIYILKLFLGG